MIFSADGSNVSDKKHDEASIFRVAVAAFLKSNITNPTNIAVNLVSPILGREVELSAAENESV